MSLSETETWDVVVVGGGPAGSTLAAFVAMRGHRVLLLEKEAFPRYQIGESLLPSTIHGIGRLLGISDELRKAGFTVKRGGTFRWGASPEPWTFNFSLSSRLTGPTAYAYQVERMKFDQILLDNARRRGVDVREQCVVTGILDGDRVSGLWYTDERRVEHEVHARFVVDASGNLSRIHRHVGGERRYSEFFRNLAIFGYFENGKRLPEPYSGNILSAAFRDGWIWYIPLSPTLTSVGVVVSRSAGRHVQGNLEASLLGFIHDCPVVSDYLADARRVTTGTYGHIRARKDYSYCKEQFWRSGIVLIGDAACFVDPVFSSGVHLATYSALLAARSINSILAGTMSEPVAFAEFERRYRREYAVFYEFLMAFYNIHAEQESYFWEARKITNCEGSEVEAFVNLVGGVSSGEAALATPSDVLAQFAGSADSLAAASKTAGPSATDFTAVHRIPIVEEVRKEGARVQARAWLGADAGADTPLFPGGLITSADGLSWATAES